MEDHLHDQTFIFKRPKMAALPLLLLRPLERSQS
jgi:hypothetical protein